MTRQETADLLEIIVAAYPNAKLGDAKRMVDAWQMAFGEDDASEIYKAARLHMKTSPYFPTIADIQNKRYKGMLIYSDRMQNPALPDKNVSQIPQLGDGEQYLDYMDVLLDLGLEDDE